MVSYERLRFVAAPRQEKKEGRPIEHPYHTVTIFVDVRR